LACGAQQSRGLGDPLVRIGPDRRAVLRDGQVEARLRQRHGLGIAQDEWKLDPELLLEATRGLELRRRVVDADGLGAASGQPSRDVACAAPELDDVLAVEILRQQVHVGLRDGPDSPSRVRAGPVASPSVDPVMGHAVPVLAVTPNVLRQLLRQGPTPSSWACRRGRRRQ
jgi:hypothetical protein